MDHLNIFNYFENRPLYHEDVLTRNFLLLLKNIPLVQSGFFELIRKTMSKENIQAESIAYDDLKLSRIYTQVDCNNKLFANISNINILSIILSDEKLESDHTVEDSDRHARYDGVIFCDPSWLFIIENKPSKKNIWEDQLNPNVKQINNCNIIEKPCPLSWRDVLSLCQNLLLGDNLLPIERTIINEFLEYIDSTYGWLKPFNKFELCKTNITLLNKRCVAVMEKYKEGTTVEYRKGWKYYFKTSNNYITNVALDFDADTRSVNLWMYAGNTMVSAREVYDHLNMEKLFSLQKNDSGYTFGTDLHLSHINQNLVHLHGSLDIKEYLEFWKEKQRQGKINAIKRSEFENFYDNLKKAGLASDLDDAEFKRTVTDKNRQTLNICPGFLIKYTWELATAVELDNQNKFEDDFRKKVNSIFSVFEKA